jgi:hypothetical protein
VTDREHQLLRQLEALLRERTAFGCGTVPWWEAVRDKLAKLDAERARARSALLCAVLTHVVPRADAE